MARGYGFCDHGVDAKEWLKGEYCFSVPGKCSMIESTKIPTKNRTLLNPEESRRFRLRVSD